eukprot:symbB.v1.2.026082.t1/scaffold2508.1/size77433/2
MLLGFPSPCCLTGQGAGSFPRPKPPGLQSPRCFGDRGGTSRCSWPKQPSASQILAPCEADQQNVALVPLDTFHIFYVCKLRIFEPQVQEHSP